MLMKKKVHAVMYSYYFLAACSIRLPAWFSQCLTSAQIIQFLVTLVILLHVGIKLMMGDQKLVDTTMASYFYCLIMEVIIKPYFLFRFFF